MSDDFEYEYAVDDGPEAPGVGRWMRRVVGPWEPDPNDARWSETSDE